MQREKSEKEKYFMVKQVESKKKKIKLIESRMGVAEGWKIRGKGEMLVKGYRLSSDEKRSEDLMYSLVTIVNSTVLYS